MKKLHKSFSSFALNFAFAFSILIGFSVSAQTNPIQTNISTGAPYLNYLSYYGDQNNHLQITLTNLDFSLPPELVRLRIRIEGAGYELYTNPNATIGQPFLLEAGMPLTITGIDLLPYLQPSNLINPSGVDLNNLPHGFTTICVDVIRQSALQQVLSTNNCGFLPIQEYQPPQTFVPSCGSVLDTNTMFHTFTWTPPMPMPVGMDLEILYDLEIFHWDNPLNNTVLLGGYPPIIPPLLDLTTNTTQISDFNGLLELGETYVWRVRARVLSNGMEIPLIENNGYSAPCTFIYGEAPTLADVLGDGLELELFTEPSSERKGKAWWTVTDNTPNEGLSTFDAYFVEYRKQPTGNEGFEIPWFSKTLSSFEHFIYQLEPSTTYEVKVSGVIAGTVGDPTPVETFTTPDPRVYNCGESDVPYLPTNYTPLENATVGTQVKIGQFMMTMTEVVAIGSAGHYAGKGEIPIAFLAGAKAKVRFDDILIDTEYLVHEGRVDVITEGLANWLDDQYQQFIDPYFVNGTIDSAWVQDSVAWLTIDGVDTSFVFDPPHYPIIVNDASGNQYTIYPNGTIVVSTYLSVSETWAIAENQTARFGQNEDENRGFDPMEHMEWYENYETMKLSDNTFYYVANKSMAKNETDKVNVQFPPNVDSMSFELADGTPIGVVALEGAWDGNKPYLDSGLVRTLNLPSFSSSGKKEIHAYANNMKVGQLNIHVYNQKDKELIVVPLVANLGISDLDIENELKRTLGEANINVTVSITNPWIDATNTFTASSNIAMPSEVGLMTKYSDDMRGLRDAYFDQNPSAPKNKYYVFLVNGFDDPTALGYMVRGRSMGFVKADPNNPTQILQTISHELGHGMGALEHTFKTNGLAQGSTNNLMDYSADPTNLTIAQWKELRDFDLVPSLLDGVEDGSSVQLDITEIPENFKNEDGTFSFATPSGEVITIPQNLSSVTFSTRDPLYYSTSEATGESVPIGSLIAFEIFDGTNTIPFAYQQIGEVFWFKNKAITAIENTTVSAGMGANAPPLVDSTNLYAFEIAYWTCYYDTLTKNRTSANVILGFANYYAGEIGFNIHVSPRSTNESEVRNAYLANSDAFFAIDFNRTDHPVSNAAQWESAGDYYAAYFKSIEGTSVKIKSGLNADDFSAVAKQYLDRFSEWAKPDAITAPIVVAIAQWVSTHEAMENHSICALSGMSDVSPLYTWSEQEDLNNPLVNPGSPIPVGTIQSENSPELAPFYVANESEILFKEVWAFEKTFYLIANQIENSFDTEVEINSEMSVAQTTSEVKSVMSDYYTPNLCSYWLVSGVNRLNAITSLKSANNDDAALSDIIDLTITAKDNGQLDLMLDAFFSNGAQLYWTVVEKMTDGINHPRYNDFIHALLEMSIINNSENNYESSVGYYILDLTVNEYVSSNLYSFRVETGGSNCIGGSCYKDTTIHCSPNDFVQVNLNSIDNTQLKDFYQHLGMSGKQVIVPAFYLAYLEYNRSFQNKMFAASMLLDAFAIIAAIPTGGASISTMGALTIGMSSANILVTVNESAIAEFSWGTDFLNLWQVAQLVDATNAIYMVGKGITKQTINGISKIYYNSNEILDAMESTVLSVKNDAKSAYHLSRDAFGYIKQVSSTKGTQFYNYVLQKLDAAYLRNYKTSILDNNYDIDILNSHNVVVLTPNGSQNILTLENNSGGIFLKGNIDEVVDNNATLLAVFDNVRYRKNSSTQIDFGDLSVYKKVNGNITIVGSNGTLLDAVQLKFAGKTNVLNWLPEISSNTEILAKLNDLPNSSHNSLDIDLGSNSNLKINFEGNEELIEGWGVLQSSGASNLVRCNIKSQEIIVKHLDNTNESSTNVSNQISSSGGFDEWTTGIINNASGRTDLKIKLKNYGYSKCGDAVSDASNVASRNKSKLHLDTEIPNAVNDYSYTINGNIYIKGTTESWEDYFARLKTSPDINGFESHHIFPVNLFKYNSFRKWYELIGSNSFSMNGENILENLIMLEKKTGGRGVHSNHPTYTSVIGAYFDSRFNTYLGQNYTETEALALLDDDIMNLRSNLKTAILENSVRNSVELSTFWSSIQFNTLIN